MIFMRTERTWHGTGGCKYVPALCSIVSIDSSYGMRDCRGCNWYESESLLHLSPFK